MADEATRLAKMETILEVIKEQVSHLVGSIAVVTQVQTELSHTRDSLGRAFDRIEAHEIDFRKHQEASREKHEQTAADHRKLEMKVNVYVASVIGIMTGISGVMALIAWVVSHNIVGALQAVAKASGTH